MSVLSKIKEGPVLDFIFKLDVDISLVKNETEEPAEETPEEKADRQIRNFAYEKTFQDM